MILSQIEPLTQQVLGMFALAAIVLLGVTGTVIAIAVGLKTLMAKPAILLAVSDQPVTRIVLEAAVETINLRLDNLAARETVTVLGARVLNLENEQKQLERYTRNSTHAIRNDLHHLSLTLAVIATTLKIEIPVRGKGDIDEDPPSHSDEHVE